MARVRLYLDHPSPPVTYRFLRPGGTDSIDGLRLFTYLDLRPLMPGPANRLAVGLQKAVIDTGSHLSIFREDIWRCFDRRLVTWLPFDPATPPGMRLLTIAGGTFPYELGEVTAVFRDKDGNAACLMFAEVCAWATQSRFHFRTRKAGVGSGGVAHISAQRLDICDARSVRRMARRSDASFGLELR